MDNYDPETEPDPQEWLQLDDDEKLILIESFHDRAGIEAPAGGSGLHATMHAIVENQIALGIEAVGETVARLVRQGLPRHEAIHAIAAVLSEDIFDLLQESAGEFDVEHYRARLARLSARRWRKGKY